MITVNGVEKTLEKPLSVTEYLETNKYVPVQVAIELNDKILIWNNHFEGGRCYGNRKFYGRRKRQK